MLVDQQAQQRSHSLVIAPHPLTHEGRRVVCTDVRTQETLAELLTRHDVDLTAGDWIVSIDGAQVTRLMWSRTRVKPGHQISCRRVVGRQVLAIVAIIVIAYFTYGQGLAAEGGLGGYLGATGFTAFAINAVAFMAGAMLVNKMLLPKLQVPSTQAQTTSQTYSVSGGQNRARPWEPLPLLLGQLRVTPDLATNPYQWFAGDDQYQYVRLHGGINCGAIDAIQIGDTSLDQYQEVDLATAGLVAPDTGMMDWSNVDEVAGGTLEAPGGGTGPWTVRTTSANTVRIGLDFAASLYDMKEDGSFNTAYVQYNIEYRLLPSGTFQPLFDATDFMSSRSTTPVRKTYLSAKLPAGQYEVRARKIPADVSTSRASNTLEWGSLKSYQLDDGDYGGYAQVGIKIRASGQINGALNTVNWYATSLATDVWDGESWVSQVTSNPGAQILQLARGIYDVDGRLVAGLGWPDAQIDIEGLKAFTVHCTEKGYRFDLWQDETVSVQELLESIAQAGFGSISWHPGRLSVVWLRDDQPIEDVVNMANILKGSFRLDYQTRALADELEVAWLDRVTWLQRSLRIKAPGVDVPQNTAHVAPVGVTTEADASQRGLLTMAQNVFQRKSVSWELDLEHLNFRRFGRVALSHDMTAWGAGGRLAAVTNPSGDVVLGLDQEVQAAPSGVDCYVGLRLPGEAQYRIFEVQPPTAATRQLQLLDDWPEGIPLPGSSPDDPAHDTLWIYDFKAVPGQALRVVSIEPGSDIHSARVTAVPEGPEFWDYVATGEYTPNPLPISATPLMASNAVVTQSRLDLNYDAQTQLTVTFDVKGPYDHAEIWGAWDGQPLQLQATTKTRSSPPINVAAQGLYVVEVRPFTGLGRVGTVATADVTVGLSDPIAGDDAKLLTLMSTGQVFTYNAADSASPSSQTLSFTAQLANLAGTATFVCTLFDVSGSSLGPVTMGGSGNTRTLSVAQFGSAQFATVQASLSGLSDQVTAVRLKDGSAGTPGVNAIVGLLTSESVTVAADSAGTVASFAGTGGTFKVFNGTADVTIGGSVTFSVQASSGITGMAITSAGVYGLTGMTADTGTATLRAVYGGVTVDKVYRISKSRAGTPGAAGTNANLLTLQATGQTFAFNASNSASPSSQTLSFTAQLANLTGTATFVCTLYDASGSSLGPVTMGGSGNTRTLSVAQFSSAQFATVQASLSGLSDQVTVVRLKDGAAGTSPVVGLLTNESATVAADSTGVVASFTGTGGTFKVFSGTTDVTSSGSVTFSVVAATGITGMAIASSGVYSLTGLTADTGTATLRAVYGGVTVDKVYAISKSKAGAPGAAGTNASLLTLLATGQAFTYNTSNSANPSSQTLSFTAQLANLAGTATFTCTLYDASGSSLGPVTMGGSGNTRTLTVAQFSSAQFAIVQASLSGLSDQVTLVRLRDGAAGVNAVVGLLTNESVTVAADSAGTVASFTGTGGTFKVFNGTTDVTTGGAVTFSVGGSTGITGMAITSAGVYSLTGMTTDSALSTLRAIYNGVTVDKVYSIAKARAGVAGANAIRIELSTIAASVLADASGTVVSGGFDQAVTTIRVLDGQTDVTGSWALSRSNGTGIGSTLSGATLTVTGMSVDTGYVDITATRSGFASLTVRFVLARVRGSAPTSGPVPSVYVNSDGVNATSHSASFCNVRFETNGQISVRGSPSSTYIVDGEWFSPATTNVGSSPGYWMKSISLSGDAPGTGTLNTIQKLDTARDFGFNTGTTGPTLAGSQKHTIYSDAAGTNIVGVVYTDMTAEWV